MLCSLAQYVLWPFHASQTSATLDCPDYEINKDHPEIANVLPALVEPKEPFPRQRHALGDLVGFLLGAPDVSNRDSSMFLNFGEQRQKGFARRVV